MLINNEISHEDFMTIINEEKNIENYKKALEWWIVKEVPLKKLTWLKMAKKIGINKLLSTIKLLIKV